MSKRYNLTTLIFVFLRKFCIRNTKKLFYPNFFPVKVTRRFNMDVYIETFLRDSWLCLDQLPTGRSCLSRPIKILDTRSVSQWDWDWYLVSFIEKILRNTCKLTSMNGWITQLLFWRILVRISAAWCSRLICWINRNLYDWQ